MKPYPYTLFTVENGTVSHHPEEAWPAVLADMAEDFKNFPMVLELWLRQERAGSNDTVCLWKR